jgi:hypothetical protein
VPATPLPEIEVPGVVGMGPSEGLGHSGRTVGDDDKVDVVRR